jgi:hypothetical protein
MAGIVHCPVPTATAPAAIVAAGFGERVADFVESHAWCWRWRPVRVRNHPVAGAAGHGSSRRSNRVRHPTISKECVTMAKGMEQKKQEKKKPEKTLKEKRAAKQEKKGK